MVSEKDIDSLLESMLVFRHASGYCFLLSGCIVDAPINVCILVHAKESPT